LTQVITIFIAMRCDERTVAPNWVVSDEHLTSFKPNIDT